jgi:D-3-phosphoglycerate dehydrogenase
MKIVKAAPGLDPYNYLAARLPGDIVMEADFSRPLAAQVGDAEVLLLRDMPITGEVIDAAPHLKLLQRYGQHVVGVDMAHARMRGVPVARIPSAVSKSDIVVAEHAFYLMMALAKRQRQSQQALHRARLGFPETELLSGKTLALMGIGGTGAQLARMARAFGMQVVACKRRLDDLDGAGPYLAQTWPVDRVSEMLATADYVSLHLPLNENTRGTIGPEFFAAMRSDAYFVNIARGEIVDKAGLLAALRGRHIAGAAIDVFWGEADFRPAEFEAMDNLLCTPHIAGASIDCLQALAEAAAININRVREGKAPMYVVEGHGDD